MCNGPKWERESSEAASQVYTAPWYGGRKPEWTWVYAVRDDWEVKPSGGVGV
jgi:hypothetical protein